MRPQSFASKWNVWVDSGSAPSRSIRFRFYLNGESAAIHNALRVFLFLNALVFLALEGPGPRRLFFGQQPAPGGIHPREESCRTRPQLSGLSLLQEYFSFPKNSSSSI